MRWRKLWEIERRYHCSIIGTCLDMDELRRICRKAQMVFSAPTTDYDVHVAVVSAVGQQGAINHLVQKRLDQKFKATLQRFGRERSAQGLQRLWEAFRDDGSVAAAYWALLSHTDTNEALRSRVYGEIHMLSHLAGAALRVDMEKLATLRRHHAQMQQQLAESETSRQCLFKENGELMARLHASTAATLDAERHAGMLEQRLAESATHDASHHELADLRKVLEKMQARAERAETALARSVDLTAQIEAHNQCLQVQWLEMRGERDALEASLRETLLGDCSGRCHAGGDEGGDLDGRCVLYVGGRVHLCPEFRALVEQRNGRFIHHDGGREEGKLRLESLLSQADAVLCPVDCVSHDAMNRVKQFCKCNGKRLVFLRSASLSAFTRGLHRAAIQE